MRVNESKIESISPRSLILTAESERSSKQNAENAHSPSSKGATLRRSTETKYTGMRKSVPND